MYKFVPGLELNHNFYHNIVKGLIADNFPGLQYSASLIGYGSDVLGYDNPISMDHNWGPRMQIFLRDEDYEEYKGKIDELLKWKLPLTYRDFPTNFTDPRFDRTQAMAPTDTYPVRHLIEISTLEQYIKARLPVNNLAVISTEEWLQFTDQQLLELTSGEVFHDGLNTLILLRERLKFYPNDIWLLRIAALWEGISQREAFVGRCGEFNDLLNQKLLTAHIVSLLIKICFYIEKKYIPYSKWFGTGFQRLDCAGKLQKQIIDILSENVPESIESKLALLYEQVIELNNRNHELPVIDNRIRNYYGRPYKVIFAEPIAENFKNNVKDEALKQIDIKKYSREFIPRSG
jgi:hypothetical protein